ncbi:gastric cancer antigen zg14 [Moniliophthora roreri]|uniref:RRM domain-containing protein n=1 Tax=Moniliophthora roreri TaxID=221103 RepID=A0A0W0FVA5_MONRR|nr:gastric cancer antigen zg14 [Moniliophthora roreri]
MPPTSTLSVGGFTVIPILYNDPSSSKTHYLYARAHIGSKNAAKNPWPNGRTLFVVNVPPDATERELLMLFKPYGTVERVVFDLDREGNDEHENNSDEEDEAEADEEMNEAEEEDEDEGHRRKRRKVTKPQPPKVVPLPTRSLRKLRKTGQIAHVIFLDSSSLDRTLTNTLQKPRLWPISGEEPSGLEHYTALHDSLRPPLDAVREHADTWMELFEFEAAKTKRQSKYRKGEAIVDEDGFTLVTRGGAYGQTLGGGVAVATKIFQETGEASERNAGRPKKKKEKSNFYAFQKAEKQRNDLIELKKKWEADKAKVEKLKASRHFKPY